MPVEIGAWGPVIITKGRYKGKVGYYDDDCDDGKTAIVYLPPAHTLDSARKDGWLFSLVGRARSVDISREHIETGATREDDYLMMALVAPRQGASEAAAVENTLNLFVDFMLRFGYPTYSASESLCEQLADLARRMAAGPVHDSAPQIPVPKEG